MAQQTEENDDDNYKRVTVICNGIGKYYRSYGWEYDKIFSNFMDDNGWGDQEEFDEQYVTDMQELQDGNPTEAQMIDFAADNDDYNFPFPKTQEQTQEAKAKYILTIIQKCDGNPDVVFSNVAFLTFDKKFFEISKEDFDTVKQIYQDQTPVLYHGGISKDLTFLQMLTICWKAPCNYLQLVVDDYLRSRAEQFVKDNNKWNLKIDDWMKLHKHFQELKKIEPLPPMPTFDDKEDKNGKKKALANAALFVRKAVYLFQHRICPILSFKPIYLINDSIENIVKYIHSGYKCVGNIVNEADRLKRPALPLQFDLCIITKPAKHTGDKKDDDDKNEDDEEDDDEEEEKEAKKTNINLSGVDCVGDIKKKLDKNELEYYTDVVNIKQQDERENGRIFTTLFNKMEFKNNPKGAAGKPYFFHKKRFIGFVDRRKKKEIDPVYFYLPPEGPYTRDIPEGAVPEWYIASSRTTLLPNLSFNMEEAIGADDSNKNTDNQSQLTEEDKLKISNIHSQSSCGGSLLTLSFHIRTNDDMAVYLYYDGKMTRFEPDDLANLLPVLFNPDYRENEQGPSNADYLQTDTFEDMIKELNDIIKDVNFVAFRQRNQKKSH